MKEKTFESTIDDKEEFICEIRRIIYIYYHQLIFICIIKSRITNYKCTFGLTESKGTSVMQKANAKSA
jgi:hypothetical protein